MSKAIAQFNLDHLNFFGVGSVGSVVWSPTGLHIAFSCRHKIYLLDVGDGTSDELARTDIDWLQDSCIKWSPDGQEFLFSMQNGQVYKANLEDKQPRLVGMAKQFCWQPNSSSRVLFWNDTGAFVADSDGKVSQANYAPGLLAPNGRHTLIDFERATRVRLANADGSEEVFLDEFLNLNENSEWTGMEYLWADKVSWAQNGNQLVFDRHSDKSRIFHVDINERRLNLVAYGLRPKLSPDGERVAYTDADTKKLTVRTIRTRSTIEIEEAGYVFDWSPNSKQIAYATFDSADSHRFNNHRIVIVGL